MSKRLSRLFIAVLILVLAALVTPGCLFRKKKSAAPQLPLAPVRLALLPANIPSDRQELHWVSLATTVIMAKQIEDARDLEVVPLWESLPIALEALGTSRTISGETPAYVASRLNAKWATQAELTPSKNGVTLLLDFMPTKSSMIAYRYEKETSIDSLHTALREAVEQFLRYLQARPLAKGGRGSKSVDTKELQAIAEAMDREYGWFAQADPGKSETTLASLARTDNRLARLLFKPAASSDSGARPATTTPENANTPAAVPSSKSQATAPPSATAPQTVLPEPSKPKPAEDPPSPPPRSAEVPPPLPASEIIQSTRAAGSNKPRNMASRSAEMPLSTAPAVPSPSAAPATAISDSPKSKEAGLARTKSATAPAPASNARTYWIQVNSTRSKSEAEAQAEKLAKAGFRPEVVQVDLKEKGLWYRVRLQGFDSRKAAEEAARKLVEEGIITEYWIVP